jgi:hypothetical protein
VRRWCFGFEVIENDVAGSPFLRNSRCQLRFQFANERRQACSRGNGIEQDSERPRHRLQGFSYCLIVTFKFQGFCAPYVV